MSTAKAFQLFTEEQVLFVVDDHWNMYRPSVFQYQLIGQTSKTFRVMVRGQRRIIYRRWNRHFFLSRDTLAEYLRTAITRRVNVYQQHVAEMVSLLALLPDYTMYVVPENAGP